MPELQYQAILSSLRETLQENNRNPSIEMDDEKLNMAAGSQIREKDVEYDNRNKLYTHLLVMYIENYQKKEKSKGIYKGIFFAVTICLFVGIVGVGLAGTFRLSVAGDGSLANVGIAITNIAGIISTLAILPKIIAEHLFPADEERNMLDMVKNMQDNDSNIRNVLYDGKEHKT